MLGIYDLPLNNQPEVSTPTSDKPGLSLDVRAVTAAAHTLIESVSVDIFSQSTRSERDRLLISALIGIAIATFVKTGKISFGGLEVDPTVWWGVPVTLISLNVYFLLTFGSLALSDRRRWRAVAERKANELIETLNEVKARVIERLEQTIQQYHLATIKALKEGRNESEISIGLDLDTSSWERWARIEIDESAVDFAITAYKDAVHNAFSNVHAVNVANDRLRFSRENTVLVWRLQNAVFVIAPVLFAVASTTCLTMFIMKHWGM